jgi:uncharacterized protein (TIGR02646 family)
MIQLKPHPKPLELTDELVKELTEKYKLTQESVWGKDFIKKALLLMSNNKCCFCECNITEDSKYMEVEHFLPKKYYPDKVLDWENLLPSCKRCNVNKLDLDTGTETIVHPVTDNPQKYLILKKYRLYKRDDSEKGHRTIEEIGLNERKRLVIKRFAVGDKLIEALEDLLEMTKDYITGIKATNQQKRKITNKLKELLLEGTPAYEFSATAATVILTDDSYPQIKNLFQQAGLWTPEFDELEQILQNASLA